MCALQLRDFELEIGPALDGVYPVAVLNSPSGQARGRMTLPWPAAKLPQRIAAWEDAVAGAGGPQAGNQARTWAGALFAALFAGDVLTVYERSRQAAEDNGYGLRLKLRLNAAELIPLPWEFLYDPRRGEYLALSRWTPLVRYLELPLGEQTLAVKPPLRILGVASTPTDASMLDVAGEKARLEEAIEPLSRAGKVELVWLEGQSWRALQGALQGGPWSVLHFIGHAVFDEAEAQGVLLLADDEGRAAPISAAQLGGLLADHRGLRLAVLNACEGGKGSADGRSSSLAAGVVRHGLPAVLAMQYAISDRAAIEFTTSFYSALAAGLPIDAAVSEARKAIDLAQPGALEWGTLQLTMRTPDGALWQVQPARRSPRAVWLAAGAAALVVLALLAWLGSNQARLARAVNQPTPTATASPTPARMSGTFNIAIADFGQLDPATGQVSASEEGRLLSQWLAENLEAELQSTARRDLPGRVEVWHDAVENPRKNVQLGIMPGASPEERQQAAAQLASEIRATLVIYGDIVGQGPEAQLDIQIFLPPALSSVDFGDLVGAQRLGRPVAGPFDAGDPLGAVVVEQEMRWRGQALYWLTLGLVQQLLGQPQQALSIFDRAEQTLQDWPEQEGKEILYFFQGREHFFLSRQRAGEAREAALDAAEQSLRRALALNPQYARARAALGSVSRRRAELISDPAARLASPELARAIEAQQQAWQDAQAARDPLLAAVVQVALAKSYRLQGETYYLLERHADAQTAFDQAVAEAAQTMAPLEQARAYRLLAQSYETTAAARLQQADSLRRTNHLPAARERIGDAVSAYQSCLAQAEQASRDQILLNEVIGPTPAGVDAEDGAATAGCRQGLSLAQQMAHDLGATSP